MSDASLLENHLGYWMRMVSNQVSHSFANLLAGQGVTVAEWVAMNCLDELGPTAPHLLAERMGMTRGAISKLVKRLEAKGLVNRSSRPNNHRIQIVELSAEGTEMLPLLRQAADENDAHFFGALTLRERDELMRVLQSLARRSGVKFPPTE